MTNNKCRSFIFIDSFNRTGAGVLIGVLVGTLGLILAAVGYPIGERAMDIGYAWAARSMWGNSNDDPTDLTSKDKD